VATRLRITAALAGTALALASFTGAAAGTPHQSTSLKFRPLTTPQAVDRALPGPQLPTLYVNDGQGSRRGIFYGIAWVLYHDSSHPGISDDAPGSAAVRSQVLVTILEGAASGFIVWVATHAGKVYRFVKKYIFRRGSGGHNKLIQNDGDGLCMASFAQDQSDGLKNCGDRHGIYWTLARSGKIWNTYTGGMVQAVSNNDGAQITTDYPTGDWYTWAHVNVCCTCGC
jgi:hypothetical protein